MNTDWKPIVAAVAPKLATMLGGPLAGAATSVLASHVLGDKPSDATLEDVIATGDPEVLAKIKQAELDFEQRMAELNVDLAKISADDRDSARRRQVETKDNAPWVLALVIIAGFFVSLAAVFIVNLPERMNEVVFFMLGGLQTAMMSVVTYYYGTNSSSTMKTKLLADSIPSKKAYEQ